MAFAVGVALLLGATLCDRHSNAGAAEPDAPPKAGAPIDFSSQIRPILAAHCWSCHGPDESTRAAQLRLDLRESAIQPRPDSTPAIVPGQAAASGLVARIRAEDETIRMPPAETKKPLTEAQKKLLERWIAEGARFAKHWSFEPIRRPPLPETTADLRDGELGAVDRFARAKLATSGLRPSAPADRETLLRRATLDVTGLPPTPDELDAFLADDQPDAYDRALDRLFASPRYGERMAMQWLDLARYADTNGYNNDEHRTMWPWRDWVINAFNRHQPYDQFIVEQLAGDLLPEPTLDQRVATGFNRNHVLTTEGGIIDEEYRVEYVADRVHTTATVFLGLSLQCARCHEHKYDPISQREYFQFFSYFNVLPDRGVGYNKEGTAPPAVRVPSLAQRTELERLARREESAKSQLAAREASAADRVAAWEATLTAADRERLAASDAIAHLKLDESSGSEAADAIDAKRKGAVRGAAKWGPGKFGNGLEFDGSTHVVFETLGGFDSADRFSFSVWVWPEASDAQAILSRMDDAAAYRGYDILLESGRVVVHLIDQWPNDALKVLAKSSMSLREWHHVAVTYDGSRKAAGVVLYVDGKRIETEVERDQLRGTLRTDKPFHLGRRQNSIPLRGKLDDVRIFATTLSAEDVARLTAGHDVSRGAQLLAVAPGERSAEQRAELAKLYFARFDAEASRLRADLAEIAPRRATIEREIPQVMVMEEKGERPVTRILRRGQYDQPTDAVTPATPRALPAPPVDAPANRLGLARWLISADHPLTARVAVNRWWELAFGQGIVETVEDFGVTGSPPTHPELLDWLASELLANGWDMQRVQRAIYSSATYRQTSAASAEARQIDPRNQWLARGPRFRLPAELLRDQALAVAGLLVDQRGGPSVKPYQPEGLWEDVSVERREKYVPDAGAGLYRRTMYSYWKRTCPPPSLSTFDAPTRETCVIRRARTNTPLQALILLNDPTYVEAARQLAQRVLREAPADDRERLRLAFRCATARGPRGAEEQLLRELLADAREQFAARPERALELLAVGKSPRDERLDAAELAAWSVVGATILNLDSTLSKE